jgi:hypothetical protein
MIDEETLINIMEAADFDDHEDVTIRALLVIALRKSGFDFADHARGRTAESDNDRSLPAPPPTG